MLEKYTVKEEFEEMLRRLEEAIDKISKDLQVKFAAEYCELYSTVQEIIKNKIRECGQERGIWQGVIGRTSLEILEQDGFREWSRDPEASYRIVEGYVNDDATTWVGYTSCKHLRDSSVQMISEFESTLIGGR